MKYNITIGKGADKGHIRPIAVAYSLGKQCIGGNTNSYTNQFRNWYKELVDGSAQTHALFQTELNTTDEYPLEAYNPDKNTGVMYAQLKNPIIPAGTPSTPKSNSSNSMNWKSTPKKTSKKKSNKTKTKKQRRS